MPVIAAVSPDPLGFPLGALLALGARRLHPATVDERLPPRDDRAEADGPPSLEQLFRRHFDDVYRIVASLLGPGATDADVEDLTQQVFLAAHRALPQFRGESRITTWLYGIASRVVLTFLRSRRRRKRLREAVEVATRLPRYTRGPEDEVRELQELTRVWRHLMRIDPKKRVVFILYEVEGLSGAEIAQSLGLRDGTVWTRLHYARRELVEAMKREET